MNAAMLIPFGVIVVWNLIVWAVWRWDKHLAGIPGRRRIPEATLVLLARLCGSAGALAAMYLHKQRHKVRSLDIVKDVWFAAVAHVAILVIAASQVL